MDILERIVADKRRELILKKHVVPVKQLEKTVLFSGTTSSLASRLAEKKAGIIAEHKRRSPSKSVINQSHSLEDIVKGYATAGACGISILTDGKYFGGSLDDLLLARAAVKAPLLRKEFMIDEYQVIEAKAHGADAILLIAAVLSRSEISQLSQLAKSLEMEVLLEVHNEKELKESLVPGIDMIGVNNRNLKTFEVSLQTSRHLAALIPDEFVKVSESGISTTAAIKELSSLGYRGFLMGEYFMKTDNPGQMATEFINTLSK